MLKFHRVIILATVTVLLSGVLPHFSALAAVNCNVSVSPSTVDTGTEAMLQFDVTNTGTNSIAWMQLQHPSVSYSVNGITQSGWTDTTDENGTTLAAGSLAAGSSYSFQLVMFTGPVEEAAAPWSALISTNADGSGAVACGGALNTAIVTATGPPVPNGESSIGLTSITPTTATIGWTSDVPSTSYVYFGTDATYGRTATATGSGDVHSVFLSGLNPSTIYHFKVAGTDDSGNGLFSGDNTFVTPVRPPTPVVIPGDRPQGPVAVNIPGVVNKAVPTETVPPTVSLLTDLSKPFKQVPTITGRAGDNEAVARLEYSVDNGKDWLPVDQVAAAGKGSSASAKDVTFSFTPIISDDGNYQLMVRATDSSGNKAAISPQMLIIDRLPPQVGELVTSLGPEILTPDSTDALTLVAGSEYQLATSTIGGATSVTIQAHWRSTTKITGSFALAQSPESGLWSGVMDIGLSGRFELDADSFDGAGNHTVRPLGTITVLPAGRTVDAAGQHIDGATVTLYYLEPSTKTWVVWDGAPYSQTNPQVTKLGAYSLMVPAGQYYLQAKAAGFTTTLTQSFTVHVPTSLASNITLAAAPHLRVGSVNMVMPTITMTQAPYVLGTMHIKATPNTLIGNKIADFTLPKLAGGLQRSIDLNGRPTVLSLVDLWSPLGSDQLPALAELQRNPDIGVVPIFIQDDTAHVNASLATAGTTLNGLADPDGALVNSAGIGSGPKHIFLDRSGHVKKVVIGVKTPAELQKILSSL